MLEAKMKKNTIFTH